MQISGFDATTVVSQLMQIERLPLRTLQTRKDAAKLAFDAISKIRSQTDAFRLAAAKLADRTSFDRFTATSSNADAVAVSATSAASIGGLTLGVDRLAQAHGLRSGSTVAASTAAVTSATLIAVAAGTRSIGIDRIAAGAGISAGSNIVRVTQASAGAIALGTPVAGSTVITTGVNDTVEVAVNGAARTVTLAAGNYTSGELATVMQSALDASGGGISATLDTAGALRLSTTREGSMASLQITGGSALADLGLSVQGSAVIGTDGVIDVGGTTTTVTNAEAGQSIAIATGSGTLDATLSGGLRVGETTVKTVSTGSRSLADVAAAINAANAGVSAAAVKVADGAWRLQLSARATGEAGRISIDTSAFTGLGGMVESSAAQNARITIGTGPGAYQIEASGNTFADVLPGVTLTAKSVTSAPVTIEVGRNDEAIASDVANLISAANTLLAEIKVQSRFDPATRNAGPLAGDRTIRALADQVRAAVGAQVDGLTGTSTNGLAASVGIEVARDGGFTFDRAKFLSASAADATAVARLFSRGGDATTTDIAFASALDGTRSGTYAVNVTTAASRATTATLFTGGAPVTTRVGVRVGSTTASVDVTAGATAGQLVQAFNDAFAGAGLSLVAETDGAGLRVRSEAWGSVGNFEINTDVLGAGSWTAVAGADVQGSINGKAATGIGRRLTLPATADDPAAGLAIDVTGGLSGAVGSIQYRPGLAARVLELTTALTSQTGGQLTNAKDAADRRVKGLNDQITRFEDRLTIREANLRRQYSNLQTLLGSLQNQGQWLTGQIASLPQLGG